MLTIRNRTSPIPIRYRELKKRNNIECILVKSINKYWTYFDVCGVKALIEASYNPLRLAIEVAATPDSPLINMFSKNELIYGISRALGIWGKLETVSGQEVWSWEHEGGSQNLHWDTDVQC